MRASVLALALLTSGCAIPGGPFQGYKANPDPFAPQVEKYFCDPVHIGSRLLTMDLNLAARQGARSWYAEVELVSEDWLFIESLQLLVDGRILRAQESGSPIREVVSSYVHEVARFPLSQETIEAIAQAQSITARVGGAHYYREGALAPEDVANLRWFVEWATAQSEFIGPAAQPSPPQ